MGPVTHGWDRCLGAVLVGVCGSAVGGSGAVGLGWAGYGPFFISGMFVVTTNYRHL